MANDFGNFVFGLFCETREVVYSPESTKGFRMATIVVSEYSRVSEFLISAQEKYGNICVLQFGTSRSQRNLVTHQS
jgi:hypothetical protein